MHTLRAVATKSAENAREIAGSGDNVLTFHSRPLTLGLINHNSTNSQWSIIV